jgi:hypothetical protein
MARTRKQKYRGSKAFDRSCRNHGTCSYCSRNRQYFDIKYREAKDMEVKEFFDALHELITFREEVQDALCYAALTGRTYEEAWEFLQSQKTQKE